MKKTIIVLVILVNQLWAQNVNIDISTASPMPALISDWTNNPNSVVITIYPVVKNEKCTLTIQIKLNDRELATLKEYPDVIDSPFTVRGGVLDYTAFTVKDPSLKDQALTTNMLPEGEYQLCVTFDQGSLHGENCKDLDIYIPEPPNLLQPANGDEVSNHPQFSWTPLTSFAPGPQQLNYKIKIVPVFEGQTDRDAIDRNQVLIEETLQNTSYPYLSSNQPFSFFSDAVRFAWQVQAVYENDIPAARNEGKSEIFTFTVPNQESMNIENIDNQISRSIASLRSHHRDNQELMSVVDSIESNARYIFNSINSPDSFYIRSLVTHANLLEEISSSPPESIVVKTAKDINGDFEQKRSCAEEKNNSPEAFKVIPFDLKIIDVDTLNKDPFKIYATAWALRDTHDSTLIVDEYGETPVEVETLVAGVYDIWAVPVREEKLRYPRVEENVKVHICIKSYSIFIVKGSEQ